MGFGVQFGMCGASRRIRGVRIPEPSTEVWDCGLSACRRLLILESKASTSSCRAQTVQAALKDVVPAGGRGLSWVFSESSLGEFGGC